MTHLVVVGHSGQVASELRSLDLPAGWRLSGINRHALDLARPETFERKLAALQPDAIINAAAYTAVDKAETEDELALAVNGHAPGELARVACAWGIPFLHVSTDYVFDGTSVQPYAEDDRPNPINVYGLSKLAGERAVLDCGSRAVILRTSWVFSPVGSNFVKTMLRLAAQRDELSIVADQHGGPTPARDIASTLVEIAQHLVDDPQAPCGIFHYSGQSPTSWADFAAAIFEGADWLDRRPAITKIATSQFPTAAKRPLYSVLDCSRLHRCHGIEQPDWRDGLERTLNSLRPETSRHEVS